MLRHVGWPATADSVSFSAAPATTVFGFEPAAAYGVWYSQVGPGDPHFMLRRLSAFSGCARGGYQYPCER